MGVARYPLKVRECPDCFKLFLLLFRDVLLYDVVQAFLVEICDIAELCLDTYCSLCELIFKPFIFGLFTVCAPKRVSTHQQILLFLVARYWFLIKSDTEINIALNLSLVKYRGPFLVIELDDLIHVWSFDFVLRQNASSTTQRRFALFYDMERRNLVCFFVLRNYSSR